MSVVQEIPTSPSQEARLAKKTESEPIDDFEVDDLIKDADWEKGANATPTFSSDSKVEIVSGGLAKLKKRLLDNPQCKQTFGKVAELWDKKLAPVVGPYVLKIADAHSQYPGFEKNVFAAVLIFYGACFSNLVVLYAAFVLAGTFDVVNTFLSIVNNFHTEFGFKNGIFALLRSTAPSDINKLLAAICVQICVLKLMVGWLPAFAICLGCSVANYFCTFKPEIVAVIKKKGLLPADLEKWAPFCAKNAITVVAAVIAAIAPTFTTGVLAAFYGVEQMEKTKSAKGRVKCGIAVAAAAWQCYCEYETCFFTYVILSPLFLVNSLL